MQSMFNTIASTLNHSMLILWFRRAPLESLMHGKQLIQCPMKQPPVVVEAVVEDAGMGVHKGQGVWLRLGMQKVGLGEVAAHWRKIVHVFLQIYNMLYVLLEWVLGRGIPCWLRWCSKTRIHSCSSASSRNARSFRAVTTLKSSSSHWVKIFTISRTFSWTRGSTAEKMDALDEVDTLGELSALVEARAAACSSLNWWHGLVLWL